MLADRFFRPASLRVVLPALLLLLLASVVSSQEATGIEAALPAIRQMNDPVVLLNALNGAAMQKMQAGDVDRAIEFIDESISLARKLGDPAQLQGPLMTATQILNRTSPDRATKFLLSLLNSEESNPEIERMILQRLGEHLQRSGDIVAAIQVFHDFQQRCKQAEATGETIAWALLQYGQACLNGKMFDLAQPALKECKALAESEGHDEIAALCAASLANACLGTEQYDVAADLSLAQLQSAKKAQDENSAFSAIAGLVTALIGGGKLDDAATVLKNNIPESTGMLQGELLGLRATLQQLGGDEQAALSSSEAAEAARMQALPLIARAMAAAPTVMNDKLAQAYLHFRLGELDASLAAADAAEAGYVQIRKSVEQAAKVGAVNLDSTMTAYSTLLTSISQIRQQVLVAQGKQSAALLEAENSRGGVQADAMKRLFGVPTEQLAATATSIAQMKELAKQNRVTFVEYSVVQPIDFLTRSRLGSAATQFDSKRILAWIVTPDGEVHFADLRLPITVTALVSQLRNELLPPRQTNSSAQNQDEEAATGSSQPDGTAEPRQETADQTLESNEWPEFQRLAHRLLWEPIMTHLPKDPNAVVAIIPDADLHAVPFAALVDENDTPVIATHTLVTVGSTELYRLALERRKAAGAFDPKQILVVGNPKMPSYRARPDRAPIPLDPLPGSEREAKAIANMFAINPLIGEQATESNVRSRIQHAPVIHMATHGLLEADSVFTRNYLSSIALARDEQADGFLTVREVMGMQLDAELAVLSACDSGRGTITGDGVVGLSRAYLTAGVPNVVVSLWPVSDQATAYLMVQFYRALGAGQSKAHALRTAILATREKAPAPRLWAPFVLYGIGI